MSQPTQIKLDSDAALVVFELLSNHGLESLTIALSPVELTALTVLLGALEKELSEPFRPDYTERLNAARDALLKRFGSLDV